MATQLPIALDDVRAAARRLHGVAHRTPVVRSHALDERVGATVALKVESFQRTGAFKFRGAYNSVSQLSDAELARGVVASSSGNHAQALALAAKLCGSHAVLLMPHDAPASKRAAALGHGAEVVGFDRYEDDRERMTLDLAAERGLTIVHAHDGLGTVAGAGTTALELLDEAGPLDVLVTPAGGGGLLAGSAVTAKALRGETRIVGVAPSVSDVVRRSLEAGRRVEIEVGATIADGLQLAMCGELPFTVIDALVDEVVTVTDAEIVEAMRFLFERTKLVVEPSGAVGVAALLSGRLEASGRVGVVLTGGNVDADRFASLVVGLDTE